MIVTKLMGGLGNQMFQYSLGRRLAYERGVPLKLDLSWFGNPQQIGNDTAREYALGGWRIHASIATADDISGFPARSGMLARLGLSRTAVVRDRAEGFDATVLRVPARAYLAGYWHCEKYFKSIRDILLDEFTLIDAPCAHVAELLTQARSPCAVAVHVRRGDYVASPETHEFHGVCSVEYYQEAAQRIVSRVADASFFVFSDDPDWVRDNLRFDRPTTYVTHGKGCSPHHDIWLMSQCAHHIIANSSFSWWGAWLCRNDPKLVIAPARWFGDARYNVADLVPENWTRI